MKQKTKLKVYTGPLILAGLILAALVIIVIKLVRLSNGTDAYNDSLNTQLVLSFVFLMVFGFIGVGVWAMIAENRAKRPRSAPPPEKPYSRKEKLFFVLAVVVSSGALAVAAYDYFTGFDIAVAIICALAADIVLSVCAIFDRLKKHRVSAPQMLCTLLIAGSIAAPVGYEIHTSDLVKPFNGHIAEYESLHSMNKGPVVDSYEENEHLPPLGKVVVIDCRSDSVFKAIHFAIPEKYRAAAPEDVDTVILLYTGIVSSTYTNGQSADVLSCDIQVYDLKTSKCLFKRTLVGRYTPSSIKSSTRHGSGSFLYARLPNKKMIEYINKMLESNQ